MSVATKEEQTAVEATFDLVIGDLERDIPGLTESMATNLNTGQGCSNCTCADWYCV